MHLCVSSFFSLVRSTGPYICSTDFRQRYMLISHKPDYLTPYDSIWYTRPLVVKSSASSQPAAASPGFRNEATGSVLDR